MLELICSCRLDNFFEKDLLIHQKKRKKSQKIKSFKEGKFVKQILYFTVTTLVYDKFLKK